MIHISKVQRCFDFKYGYHPSKEHLPKFTQKPLWWHRAPQLGARVWSKSTLPTRNRTKQSWLAAVTTTDVLMKFRVMPYRVRYWDKARMKYRFMQGQTSTALPAVTTGHLLAGFLMTGLRTCVWMGCDVGSFISTSGTVMFSMAL